MAAFDIVPKSRRILLLAVVLLLCGWWTVSRDWAGLGESSEGLGKFGLGEKTAQGVNAPGEAVHKPAPETSQEEAASTAQEKDNSKDAKETQAEAPSRHGALSKPGSTTKWTFEAPRDRNDYSLTDHQCTAAFPDLYYEIDRSASYWDKHLNGAKIEASNIELDWSWDGGLQCLIYNNQLYITFSRGLNHFQHWEERSKATLHQINRAIVTSREPIPNIEFTIKINDQIGLSDKVRERPEYSNKTLWAFSRNIYDRTMDQVWLIPDFNFWSYPRVAGSFADFQHTALQIGSDFEAKKSLLVWRGTTAFNTAIREPLLNRTAGYPWSDVHRVDEDSSDADFARLRITMPDHCRYKFAVHTEGTTWSGRLKYLLSCHSAIFIHPLSWHTHLYHLLAPDGEKQNYVPVQADWADLPGKMDELLAVPEKARLIADNAAATFRDRYLTPAAQTCYWRRLFKRWADVAWTPDPFNRTATEIDGYEKVRGMTFEEYVFWDKNVPDR